MKYLVKTLVNKDQNIPLEMNLTQYWNSKLMPKKKICNNWTLLVPVSTQNKFMPKKA
jgi:hypothetical protein